MFNIEYNEQQVTVSVSLQERIYAKEPKIWIKTVDVVREIRQKYPDLEFIEKPEYDIVVSNTQEPYSGVWNFRRKIRKKGLTDRAKRAITKEDSKKTE